MKKGILIKGIAVLLFGGVLYIFAVNSLGLGGVSWHQKLTLKVETPEGIKSTSNIIKVTWGKNINIIPLPDLTKGYRNIDGDALALQLVGKQYLFITPVQASYYGPQSFRKKFPKSDYLKQTGDHLDSYRGLKKFPNIPVTVDLGGNLKIYAFKNISDPLSIELVDFKNLAGAFGDGYKFLSLNMEIVDGPVTPSIRKNPNIKDLHTKWEQLVKDAKSARKRGLDHPYFKSPLLRLRQEQFLYGR